ncbi:MAG: glutamine amidotransferase [Chloroflexota bacterium]|nr:glutamine amidotransferase [Chloroflexota bacterium]
MLEALGNTPGIHITVIDESRDPQDSSWSEALASRVDVAWFTGWDNAAHQFRPREWRNLASAAESGVGFIHTGGQGSFHGGDGRGALLDCTPLGDVLPVSLRPHDAAWDLLTPEICPTTERSAQFDLPIATMPFRGFHRVDKKPDASVHWTLAGWPLLVTGQHGAGATLAFTGSFTRALQMLSTDEQDDRFWSEASIIIAGGALDANDIVEPPWVRKDIRAYGRFWSALPEIALAFLAFVARCKPTVAPVILAREHRQTIFELLADLPATRLGCSIKSLEWDPGRKETQGVVSILNEGPVVARLVRGAVLTDGTQQHRFRDGFVDLLPGETCDLRFEAGCQPNAIAGLVVSGQNVEPTHITQIVH